MNIAATASAIGTCVAAVGSSATLIWLVVDRQRSLRDERTRRIVEQTERDRAQAQRLSAWRHERRDVSDGHPYGSLVTVNNLSDEPHWEVVVYVVWVAGSAPRTGQDVEKYAAGRDDFSVFRLRAVIALVPPGSWVFYLQGPDNSPPNGQLGVEIAFTDRVGRHWMRRSDGDLLRIEQSPMSHYGIHRPVPYTTLSTDDETAFARRFGKRTDS